MMPTGHRRPRPRPRVVVLLGQRVADRGEVLWSPAMVGAAQRRQRVAADDPDVRVGAVPGGGRALRHCWPRPGRKTIAPSALSREDKQRRRTARQQPRNRGGLSPVSYTHLTL